MTPTTRAENDVRREGIFETLRSEIRSGKYRAAVRFPSETALARRFACSRQSVVHALMSLQDLGLLRRERGAGTFLTRKAQLYGSSVGLIMSCIGSGEIFPPICRELLRLSQSEGLTLLLGADASDSADAGAARALELAQRFVESKVAGVIFQPMEYYRESERCNREIVSVFERAKIPVVLIDRDIVPTPRRSPYDVVGINNFSAGRRLAQHLVECGASRVRFLLKPQCAATVLERMIGAQSVLGADGSFPLEADPSDVRAIGEAVRGRHGADAFICGNDAIAVRLLATLRKLGRRVPDDVLVAGVDDVAFAALATPPLTTVRQPCAAIAREAFTRLLSRIEDPDQVPRECCLDAPLVVRASTQRKKGERGCRR